MPRPCTVCSSSSLSAIDAALGMGVSVPAIATNHNLASSSVYRHKRNHLPGPVTDDVLDLDVTELGARMLSIVDDLRTQRLTAQAVGSRADAIKLAGLELRGLDALGNRLGIDSTVTLDSLSTATSILRSIQRFAVTDPEAASGLIAELARHPETEDVAEALTARLTRKEIA